MAFGRKRTYASRNTSALGPSKRRKTFGRRRRYSKRSNTITSKSSYGTSFGYKGKKVSRSRYRRTLWNATTAKTKYRSIVARLTTSTAPIGGVTQVNSVFNALQNAAGDMFWTSVGGALNTEDSIVPLFEPDSIVIRGGMLTMKCNNDSAVADPVVVRVWLYRNHSDFSGGNWAGTFPAGFDPTMSLEPSKNLGKLCVFKEFILENSNMGEVSYRLPMMEINSINFQAGLQGYFWLTSVHAPAGLASNVQLNNGFNLSFVGDVV